MTLQRQCGQTGSIAVRLLLGSTGGGKAQIGICTQSIVGFHLNRTGDAGEGTESGEVRRVKRLRFLQEAGTVIGYGLDADVQFGGDALARHSSRHKLE